MSAARVLEFEDLQRVTGYSRRSDVERALRSQGIRMFIGRKGPWTTLDLINQAGGLKPVESDNYDADII
ncbi:DUF4224 domain-containing protein [Pseudomonas sp. G.S.17]|uniref:DUF4224 domain-containing protein n=1 Tax=Pseudomonas sp. G.S.17 TaxID=3137451 RepID=UPI00311C9E5C